MSFFKQLFGSKKKKQEQPQLQQSATTITSGHANQSGASTSKNSGQNESFAQKQQQQVPQYSQLELEFEKLLLKTSLVSTSKNRVQTADINVTRLYLEGKKGISSEAAATQFFRVISSPQLTVTSKLKCASILHKFIIELGDGFAQYFLEANLLSILDDQQQQLTDKQQTRTISSPTNSDNRQLHEQILTPYFNYILRLANNYQIYKICIDDCMLPQSEDTKLDYKLKFMWLFKLSNLLGYVLKMQKSLVHFLRQNQSPLTNPNQQSTKKSSNSLSRNESLVQQGIQYLEDVTLLVLHDCACYYNVMSIEMEQLLATYHLLTAIDGIQFYSVFEQLIALTQEMHTFFSAKSLFDQGNLIEEPAWFIAATDKRLQKEVQDYAIKIELLNSSAASMRRMLKGSATNAHESQKCNFTETSLPQVNKSKKSPEQQKEEDDEEAAAQQFWCKTNQSEDEDEEIKENEGNAHQNDSIYMNLKLPQTQIDQLKQYEQLLLMQRRNNPESETPRENANEIPIVNTQKNVVQQQNPKTVNKAQKLQPFPQVTQPGKSNIGGGDNKTEIEKREATNSMMLQVPVEQEILFSPGKHFTFRCKTPLQMRTQPELPQPSEENAPKTPEILDEESSTQECGFNRRHGETKTEEFSNEEEEDNHHRDIKDGAVDVKENEKEQVQDTVQQDQEGEPAGVAQTVVNQDKIVHDDHDGDLECEEIVTPKLKSHNSESEVEEEEEKAESVSVTLPGIALSSTESAQVDLVKQEGGKDTLKNENEEQQEIQGNDAECIEKQEVKSTLNQIDDKREKDEIDHQEASD